MPSSKAKSLDPRSHPAGWKPHPPQPPPAPGDERPGPAKRSENAPFLTPAGGEVPFPDPPPGSPSKGYEEYFVQGLVIHGKVTRYLRERIVTPSGQALLAPLPDDVLPGSHFGPILQGHLLYRCHHCDVTQPLLKEQLLELGIDISAGQINRILTHNQGGFHEGKAQVLRAGPQTASYVGVGDTGARHEGHNG